MERVKKIRDYAFVHFAQREDAILAMNSLNGKVGSPDGPSPWRPRGHSLSLWLLPPQLVDGSPIEVTLAKPVDKDSYVRYTRGTGGRGASLQTDYAAYSIGQVRRPFPAP